MADKRVEIGRLAFRDEGAMWNAYWVESQTSMDGAVLLGSVQMAPVKASPWAKEAFMVAMRAAFDAVVEGALGERPEWGAPRTAPESERGGHA